MVALHSLSLIINAICALLVLVLIFGAILLGCRLIKGLSGNESGKNVVKTIKFSVGCGVVGGISMIAGVVFNVMNGGAAGTPLQAFIFWMLVHVTGEALGIVALFETKRQQRMKKIKEARNSTTTSTSSSSVAPDEEAK